MLPPTATSGELSKSCGPIRQPVKSPRSSDRTKRMSPAARFHSDRPPAEVGTLATLPAFQQYVGSGDPADTPDLEGMALGDADFEPHRARAAPRGRNDTLFLEPGASEEVEHFASGEFFVH